MSKMYQVEPNIEVTEAEFSQSVAIGVHRRSSSRISSSYASLAEMKMFDDRSTSSSVSSPSRGSTGMAKRLGSMLSPRGLRTGSGGSKSGNSRGGRSTSSFGQRGDSASISVISDNATIEGQMSVAKTIESQDTVKASNRIAKKPTIAPPPSSPEDSPETPKKKSKGWQKKLKRLVGSKSSQPTKSPLKSNNSSSPKPRTPPGRKRIESADVPRCSAKSTSSKSQSCSSLKSELSRNSARVTCKLDSAIRGRLDGVDVLSLGQARFTSLPPNAAEREAPSPTTLKSKSSEENKEDADNDSEADPSKTLDPLRISFTGSPTTFTSAELVSDMLWTSAGREVPELVLEGYIPGGGDRWVVRMEDPHPQQRVTSSEEALSPVSSNSNNSTTFDGGRTSPMPPALQPTDDESTAVTINDGSPSLPMPKLWDSIWGDQQPPPMPTHMKTGGDENDEESSEEVIQLAAACSVPVDLDEDAFIVSNPEHVRSVHDLVMVPLQRRKFDAAVTILMKLLRGVEANKDSRTEHLIACTHHNIGMINMFQGDFEAALKRFQKAVEVRTECLSPNHPDIAVSLVRQGTAYFALGAYDDAVASFTDALGMTPADNVTRSKILNNLGVAQFQRKEYSEALKSFTKALEIQREWLDGPVRRGPIVFDAAVTLGNIGKEYLRREDYDLAYYVYEEACLLLATTFRKDHDMVLSGRSNMALAEAKNGNYEKATQIFNSVLRCQEGRFGPDSEETMETNGMMAYLLIKQVDFDEALKYLRLVESWQKDRLDDSHPSRCMTLDTIQALEQCVEGKASVWI